MRTTGLALLALLFVFPVFGQSRSFDLTANAVWADPTSNGSFENLPDPADIDFSSSVGYGLAANIFFSDHLSTEFAIAKVNPEAQVTRRHAAVASSGNLDMMPVTGVLQWHFAPNGFIDPYVGAGAAYVLFDDYEANGVNGLERINLKDDVGLAVNAGLGIKLGSRWAINVDGKYVPLEATGNAVVVGGDQSEGRVKINPLLVSAGLSLRF